jgi:hypothetical protein
MSAPRKFLALALFVCAAGLAVPFVVLGYHNNDDIPWYILGLTVLALIVVVFQSSKHKKVVRR